MLQHKQTNKFSTLHQWIQRQKSDDYSIVVEKAVEKKIHQPSIIKRTEETQKRE